MAVQEMWATHKSPRNRPAALAQKKPSPYALRGLIRCAYCGNVMEGARRRDTMYYCCRSYKKTPGTPRDSQHQKSIYVNETALLTEINAWVSTLFAPEHRTSTAAALTTADSPDDNATQQALEVKLTAALQQRKNLQKVVTTPSKSGGDIEPGMPSRSGGMQGT